VKLSRVDNGHFIFRLSDWEKQLLALILDLYPVIPVAHHPLSKSPATADKASQKLLDDALAEHRNENKKLVKAFLADSNRFRETDGSFWMSLTAAEIEWLLQVLNDIYIGNWIRLGSPEEGAWDIEPTDENARQVGAMQVAQSFQADLLHAVSTP
jgi:hypothetical protein